MDLKNIDRLVAEHVLKISRGATFDYDGENVPKPYSSDIKAAWEVVEKFEGGTLTLTQLIDDEWSANFLGIRTEIVAQTAPLAICLAALKSYGIKYD